MSVKVCKFGGTSMSTRESVTRVADIVLSDNQRKIVVVSAPGKRTPDDIKVTDMLYACYEEFIESGDFLATLSQIKERFIALAIELGVKINLDDEFKIIEKGIKESNSPDYAASRGEYLSAKIFAEKMGWKFIDAADIICFNSDGTFNTEYTNDAVAKALQGVQHAVIPGFYGSMPNGKIKTFSRGGSDITGAIIARGAGASVYENWTDVNGFLTADPRIVSNPKPIKMLTYSELRELSYMGANVLHPEALFPLKDTGTPINVRNTFFPDHEGTIIVDCNSAPEGTVTGIAGRRGFTSINISKSMMNSELGFGRRVLSVLEYAGISFEHIPSGIDTLSVFVSDSEVMGKMEQIIAKLREAVSPDSIDIHSGMSLIATVGRGMAEKVGTAASLFGALARAGVNIRMIDQGSSEQNIIVGVETDDYERAINAIYFEFFGD